MAKDKRELEAILQKYDGVITGLQDLTADESPSRLFYILANKLSYLLDNDPETAILVKDIGRCRKIYPIFRTLGAHFLSNPQIFENRNFLRNPHSADVLPDTEITLPSEPVIWVSNHGFKDDGLASVLAAKRHAFILFGSLPQFYNTLDGITAFLNGVVMFNRKVASSRQSSIAKAVRVMQHGADLIVFPEGVWNKSPNKLMIDLWPGIYRIACETGAKIVPVVHYMRDFDNKGKNNPIHTVIDDPVHIDDLSEHAALEYVRDILATWFYLMMEIYGRTTREELLEGIGHPLEVWGHQLREGVKVVARYDKEIELSADYRPKWKVLPQDVWRPVAEIEKITKDNILHVLYARKLVEQLDREDFQRRF